MLHVALARRCAAVTARAARRGAAPALRGAVVDVTVHAPMIGRAGADALFEYPHPIDSPFMSFAPPLEAALQALLPAVWHYDGTARLQTVSARDDAWLHALLLAVARRRRTRAVEGGEKSAEEAAREPLLPVLMNTSFNTKGRPIVNSAATALQMLREEPDLDYVLIDDWLFANPTATRKNWRSSFPKRKEPPRPKPPPPKKKEAVPAAAAGGGGGFVNLGTMLGKISGGGNFGGRIGTHSG